MINFFGNSYREVVLIISWNVGNELADQFDHKIYLLPGEMHIRLFLGNTKNNLFNDSVIRNIKHKLKLQPS